MLSETEKSFLLDLARQAIFQGLEKGHRLMVNRSSIPTEHLAEPGASFVTLMKHGSLRGCIGHLEARQPLAEDVAESAWNAAFGDPRFPAVELSETDEIEVHVSVLTKPHPCPAATQAELMRHLVPGRHGLILSSGHRQATFLPSVWEQLPEPEDFIRELLHKAGIYESAWPRNMQAKLYEVEEFEGPLRGSG